MSQLQHHGVKGMKWGVRRYQNPDGTLTAEGKKRYDRDVRENLAKKKDSRIDTSSPDPKRWSREDTERSKRVVDSTSDMVRQLQKIEQETRPSSKKKQLDLSKMSEKEMREKINRELLERQYNQLFAEVDASAISRGRKAVKATLETTGTVLTVASSALGIALAIKQLKG